MFKNGALTSSHRTMFTSVKHTKTHSFPHTHSLRPPLPTWTTPALVLFLTHLILLARSRHVAAGTLVAQLHEDAFRALEQRITCDCIQLGQWNRLECPHSKAYQSLISDNRLCNVFIAQGSFLSHGQVLGGLLLNKRASINRERWHVFRLRIRNRC